MLLLINQNSMNSIWTAYEQHVDCQGLNALATWRWLWRCRINLLLSNVAVCQCLDLTEIVFAGSPAADGRRGDESDKWDQHDAGFFDSADACDLPQCRSELRSTLSNAWGWGLRKTHEKPWKTKVAENYTENESNDSNESDTADVNESDFSGNITEEPNESNFSANFSTNATQTEETGPVFALVTCVKVTLCVTLCNIKNNIMLH